MNNNLYLVVNSNRRLESAKKLNMNTVRIAQEAVERQPCCTSQNHKYLKIKQISALT